MGDVVEKGALVTGASSGIGRAIALRLAGLGYYPILVGRDAAALAQVAEQCRAHHGTDSLIIVQDLSVSGAAEAIFRQIERPGLHVEVLVNNAGFALHGEFATVALETSLEMLRVQLQILLELTHRSLRSMMALGHGHVLNVASLYSFVPVPSQALYGACKAFILNFSDAIASEVEPHGITVTTLCPGITQTAFRTRAGLADKRTSVSMSAESVANAGVAAMLAGKRLVIPGWWNRGFVFLVRHVPRGLLTGIIGVINRLRGVNRK